MSIRARVVNVYQLPEQITPTTEHNFLRELQKQVETERPCVVLDCSKLLHMDMAANHLLLSCLEEVMKRNGDIRLASLRAGAEAVLEMTGISRIFEVYATISDAIESFQKRIASLAPLTVDTGNVDHDSSYAA
jgi:anti-anti-sigma factor